MASAPADRGGGGARLIDGAGVTMYGDDLGWIHHAGFGEFARQAGPRLLKMLAAAGVPAGRLVDLGCGSGIWAACAGQAGYDVVGVDQSPALVEIARGLAPSATLCVGDVADFDLPACDAITAMGEVLSYGATEKPGDPLPALLRRAHAALRPGGVMIFDLLVAGAASLDYRTWRDGSDWAALFEVVEDRRRGWLKRSIVTFREVDGAYRRDGEVHELRVRAIEDVETAARQAGFDVVSADAYDDFPMLPRRLAFVATR